MSPDWLGTRITVVAMAIAAPIYFFILVAALPIRLAPTGQPFFDAAFNYAMVPSVFSVTWVALIYLNRYRLANTIHIMHSTMISVPLRWRIFYGLNAAFVMMFFILPVVTAPVAVIGGIALAATTYRELLRGRLGLGPAASVLAALVALALCVLPGYIALSFIPEYLAIWNTMITAWTDTWILVASGIAQCLVNALTFCSPIHFVYFGAQQFEKGVFGEVYTDTPSRGIRLLEATIFVVLLVLYLPPVSTPVGVLPFLNMRWLFATYISWASLLVVGIMTIVKRLTHVVNDTTMGGATNTVVVTLFLIVEIFFKTNLLVVTLIIWLAFAVFALVTFLSLAQASPREMY